MKFLISDIKRRPAVIAAAMLFITAFFCIIYFFYKISTPPKEFLDVYFSYMEDGWSFETENGPATPVFGASNYKTAYIPADTAGPVAVTRVLDDMGMNNMLTFSRYDIGLQVFLDSRLLYTDFPNMDNQRGKFLENIDATGIQTDLSFALPYDYAGKSLRIVYYLPSYDGYRTIPLLHMSSPLSDAVLQTTGDVPDIASVTLLMLLGLFLLFLFFINVLDGRIQWSLIPLALYFMSACVPIIENSFLAVTLGLGRPAPHIRFITSSYTVFLLLFLAMNMTGRRAKLLFCAAAFFAALCLLQFLPNMPRINMDISGFGVAVIALAAVLMLLSWRENIFFRIGFVCIAAAAGIMLLSAALQRVLNTELLNVLAAPAATMLVGNCLPFYNTICGMLAAVSAVWAILSIIKGILAQKRRELLMRVNSQMALENYSNAQNIINQTSVMRHDWKNQITALRLLWQQGDFDGLGRSLEALDSRLDGLASKHYSDNFTINTILQNTDARAQKLGINFQADAHVEANLSISENDLCSLLFNIFDNAIEAASAMPENEREISCSIKTRQGYLAIKCKNTYSGQLSIGDAGQPDTTKQNVAEHGLGLLQMRAIAKKYDGSLIVSYDERFFTIETVLRL